MLKVTSKGVEEDGYVWNITDEDRVEILMNFASCSSPAPCSKRNGVWKQENFPRDYADAEGVFHI